MWWKRFILTNAKKHKVKLSKSAQQGLISRWSRLKAAGYTMNKLKKEYKNYPKFVKWVIDFNKKNHEAQSQKNMEPFDHLFLELGTEILSNIEGWLTINPTDAAQKMKEETHKAIEHLKKSKDPKVKQIFQKHMARIDAAGGVDSLVPSEGIVFVMDDYTLKFTGQFAPQNRLNNLFKFG